MNKMKHNEYLKGLSYAEIIQIIEDIKVFHEETGVLPEKSKLRDIAKMACEDFGILYDLSVGERAFMEEVMDRYYTTYKYLSFLKQK